MKLTAKALEQIRKPEIRLELAKALKHTEYWITQLIRKNDSYGTLTTAGVLKIIREKTGFTDAEILEEETLPEKVPA